MRFFRKLVKIADRIAGSLTIFLGIVLVVIVFFQVMNRFVFHVPAPWTEEISRYIFVWLSLVGAAKALKENVHIGTQALLSRLGYKARTAVIMAKEVISLYFYFYIMVYIGANWAVYGLLEKCDTIAWLPMFYMYLSVPVSGGLMVVFSMERVLNCLLHYGDS